MPVLERPRVCVLGLGYVGLPTASLLGSQGYDVCGVDVEPRVIEGIQNGTAPYHEPGLETLVRSALNSGNLSLSPTPGEADVFIIAVPTPLGRGHQPDLSSVEAAAEALLPVVRPGNLVILESTCPVGTTRRLLGGILADSGLSIGDELLVAHCPERVLPGNIVKELVTLDRVVGGVSERSTDAAVAFMRGFLQGEIHATNAETAELTKLVENAYRDVNIAFANELSLICGEEGVDVHELIDLANRHPRVNILRPGPGVGGHCIAIDPWFIISKTPKAARLMTAARSVNKAKTEWVVTETLAAARRFLVPKIGCLGLSYKADVDDLRESPALEIAQRLHAKTRGEVLVSEPHLLEHPEFDLLDPETVIRESDLVVILVAHRAFKDLDPALFEGKIVIDAVGMLRG